MKFYKVFLVALLFSIPDTLIFGLKSYTILFIILFVFSLNEIRSINTSFVKFNSPFIYLILYSFVFVLIFNFEKDYSKLQLRYIFAKNIEILNELLLVYFLFFVEKKWDTTKLKIKRFIEIYFYINIIYIIIKSIYKPIFYYFHVSLNEFIIDGDNTREFLLGYEPSYSIPLMLLMFSLYCFVYEKKSKLLIFVLTSVYALIYGGSKSAFLLLVLFLVFYFINKYLKLFKNFISISIFFLVISFIFKSNLFIFLNNYLGINDWVNLDKSDQYEMISLVTRLESIQLSFNLLANNIMGLGIGSSIVVLSEYMNSFSLTSFEIEEATWSAITPKSQFLEYLLSGGIIFLILFFKELRKVIISINENDRYFLFTYLILIFFMFIIGERLPYILLFSSVYFISKKNKFQKI